MPTGSLPLAATRTGSATSDHGYANSGVHIGDVNLATGAPVRTRYREQVRRIAPPELIGREDELAELAAFCTASGGSGSYAWWRAEAWAGKSALMSWFVLHPPPGVRMVSFFITARLAGQSDRVAFCDNIIEQLATLLDQPIPPFLTDSTRDAHVLGMLADAAQACQARGEQLVLLTDGLDEDRGTTAGPDAHSIAALLPMDPPAGMRVIVTGRPNPPIPTDVPDHHPLRNPTIVRPLTISAAARVLRADMERDLKRLMTGSPIEQDLLGVLTAAGGGLSAADLAACTGWSAWQVEENLGTVTGRVFTRRNARWQPETGPEVYLLGHDELHTTAVRFLGSERLEGYRQRLHRWADRYRTLGWPKGTSEYLLRGYFRLLNVTSDLPRMLTCATDLARHDRMLDLSGGDTAALGEITEAQDSILSQDEPDLAAMARLAIHRDHLVDRNTRIPHELPAVWAMLGNTTRAETLAYSLTDRNKLFDRRGWALAALAKVLAEAGDLDRAESFAQSITDRDRQVEIFGALAKAAAAAGDLDRARRLATNIESIVEWTSQPFRKSEVLALLVEVTAAAGDLNRARSLATDAERLACTDTGDFYGVRDSFQQSDALIALASSLAAIGDFRHAETVARSVPEPDRRVHALAELAKETARTGHATHADALVSDAEAIADSIGDRRTRTWGLAELTKAAAAMGDAVRARRLATRAQASATEIDEQFLEASVVEAIAAAGDIDRAEMMAQSVLSPTDDVLGRLARMVAEAGDFDRAEALVQSILGPARKCDALVAVAKAAIIAGDSRRAQTLATDAETLAFSSVDPTREGQELAALVSALATAGDFDQAEALARSISDDDQKTEAAVALVASVAGAGDLDRAEAMARSIPRQVSQYRVLTVLAKKAAVVDLDRAEALGRSLDGLDWRCEVLAELAKAAAIAGASDRVHALASETETLARRIINSDRQRGIWVTLVEALAATGDLDQAEAMARSVPKPIGDAEEALANVFDKYVRPSETKATGWAHTFATPVEASDGPVNPHWHHATLTAAAKAAAAAGDPARAHRLAMDAKASARSISVPSWQSRALADLIQVMVATGDVDQARTLALDAESLARSYLNGDRHCHSAALLIRAVAASGNLDQAESLAYSIPKSDQLGQALAAMVEAVAATGDLHRARTLAADAESATRSITSPDQRSYTLATLAQALAAIGDLDRARSLTKAAEALARSINDRAMQAEPLMLLAKVAVHVSDLDLAENVAQSIADPDQQCKVLTSLALDTELGRTGRPIAWILRVHHWTAALDALAVIQPAILAVIVRELSTLTHHRRRIVDTQR